MLYQKPALLHFMRSQRFLEPVIFAQRAPSTGRTPVAAGAAIGAVISVAGVAMLML
jgi:hypothetical protein